MNWWVNRKPGWTLRRRLVGTFARKRLSRLRISLFARTLFSDEFIMFTEHDHRFGGGPVVLGEFAACGLNRSLSDQLAVVRR